VKSGYGLRTGDELKILRAAAKGGQAAGIDVVRTFLGAHAIPPEFEGRADAYVELVAGDMIDAVVRSRLASFCDVFVDDGLFTVDQVRRILTRAKTAGLGGKVHAYELASTGAAGLAATTNAGHAVGLGTEVGSLEPGKLADILVLGVPSYRHLGYRIGGNAVRVVVKRGAVQVGGPTQ